MYAIKDLLKGTANVLAKQLQIQFNRKEEIAEALMRELKNVGHVVLKTSNLKTEFVLTLIAINLILQSPTNAVSANLISN